ncbi:tRNA synthetases class I, catalytic domain-domain-containing protein [Protomyces lactucae-debilis]|uniref:glutamine--tRNA ligase n=1 Tax=Protomyces lactucae-debilis TaxID=2754530 RepID=A0A1Y2FAQ1_PROLT|nr:tRNA synthetases class I, catalytic domain-containing protein [Protomyces lactucae-debilis]ORY80989.1 tRNA synthetases class I, catalytic domain-domain-containing protein [Protomyces lactucae-debilis]
MSAEALAKLSLNDSQIKDCLKKPKFATSLLEVLAESGADATDKPTGALLMTLALTAEKKKLEQSKRAYIARAIVDGRIKTATQLDAAIAYCVSIKDNQVDDDSFDQASGVGVTVSKEQVRAVVDDYLTLNKATLEEERYKFLPKVMQTVRGDERLRWANLADLKPAVDAAVLAMIGPKDERDQVVKKKAAPKATETAAEMTTTTDIFKTGFLGALHPVGGNPQLSESLREAHLRACGGKVQTRFPPEPNGYLHIGHSKAITVNFGYARAHGGVCYLRFDDTNPEKEEEKYFLAIEEMVAWLGFKPFKVTYSSDYFDELYTFAEQLIQNGKAYTCSCTDEEIKRNRGGEERGPRLACKHRDQNQALSLEQFRGMRDGAYPPRSMTMRMKQDLEDGNPQMWDLIAYRVLSTPHHRTGDRWKIYPTYDFTHCLVDSLENITHSLCTTEFVQSRVSYEWLCDALAVYKPAQREYGRLNLQGTVMSKRKIEKLVKDGYVRDWDDPRLYTLVALKRRGVPPGAILAFVAELGVTTNMTSILTDKFEAIVRNYLELSVPRLMLVLEPLEVVLENVADDFEEVCEVPFNTKDAAMGSHPVILTKRFFIDRSDFREGLSKEEQAAFFRLTPEQPVGLVRAGHAIRVLHVQHDTSGRPTCIKAHYQTEPEYAGFKPRTHIQWVPSLGAIKATVRVQSALFHSDDPSSHPDGFLADVNKDSEEEYKDALVEPGFKHVWQHRSWPKANADAVAAGEAGAVAAQAEADSAVPGAETCRFQGLRVGYFAVDNKDAKVDGEGEGILVLNRIVSLKEDTSRKAVNKQK